MRSFTTRSTVRVLLLVGLSLLALAGIGGGRSSPLPGRLPAAAAAAGVPTFALDLVPDGPYSCPDLSTAQTALQVTPGSSFTVDGCWYGDPSLAGLPAGIVDAFIKYDDTVIKAPEIANVSPAVDDNPDLDQASLGPGWDCTGLGLRYPTGDRNPATGPGNGEASIGCYTLGISPFDTGASGRLFRVTFDVTGSVGTSTSLTTTLVVTGYDGREVGSCNPTQVMPLDCPADSVTVVYPPQYPLSGEVCAVRDCSSRLLGATVTINSNEHAPYRTVNGLFQFIDVSPGDWQLTVSPNCVPAGCFGITQVVVPGPTVHLRPDPCVDTNGDGVCEEFPTDADDDGVVDGVDNCWLVPNPDQADIDGPLSVILTGRGPGPDRTVPNAIAEGDACDLDSDNDRLYDDYEQFARPCPSASGATDPLNPDSDGDGVLDGIECILDSDPASAASKPAPDESCNDSDGDGIRSALEWRGWGTDYGSPDTDGDGEADGVEIMDVDGSGQAALADAVIIIKAASGLAPFSPGPLTAVERHAYDVDRSGAVGLSDAVAVVKFINGLPPC